MQKEEFIRTVNERGDLSYGLDNFAKIPEPKAIYDEHIGLYQPWQYLRNEQTEEEFKKTNEYAALPFDWQRFPTYEEAMRIVCAYLEESVKNDVHEISYEAEQYIKYQNNILVIMENYYHRCFRAFDPQYVNKSADKNAKNFYDTTSNNTKIYENLVAFLITQAVKESFPYLDLLKAVKYVTLTEMNFYVMLKMKEGESGDGR